MTTVIGNVVVTNHPGIMLGHCYTVEAEFHEQYTEHTFSLSTFGRQLNGAPHFQPLTQPVAKERPSSAGRRTPMHNLDFVLKDSGHTTNNNDTGHILVIRGSTHFSDPPGNLDVPCSQNLINVWKFFPITLP